MTSTLIDLPCQDKNLRQQDKSQNRLIRTVIDKREM